jgi:tRNA threonylcarbamoyl adenosine modification protein YeaZ
MKILAVEFSSEQRSVALVQGSADGVPALLGRAVETEVHRALGMVDDVLRQARCEREEIETISVGLGPGSYTGIRGAIALAQGWQLGRNVNLVGISSVEGLAAGAEQERMFGPISIIIDAQRREFYLARYEVSAGVWRETEPLRLAAWAEIENLAARGERIIGPGAREFFPAARNLYPDAAILGRLAATRRNYVPGEKLEPIYLRETSFKKAPPVRVTG